MRWWQDRQTHPQQEQRAEAAEKDNERLRGVVEALLAYRDGSQGLEGETWGRVLIALTEYELAKNKEAEARDGDV